MIIRVALRRVAAIHGVVFSELYMLLDRRFRARAQDVARQFGGVAVAAAQRSNSTLLKGLFPLAKSFFKVIV